ncbi:EthD family reductase [Curtobacterium flaccumfaciens]|uniref:EthD family reductase n=1 Tax=Curtobacterium flaccumfaciens TaxID=2035 RepID=UPI003879E70A
MPTKITLILDNPDDPAAFEPVYAQVADLARQLPELRRAESAKVWPKEDGTPTPAHRTLDLYFDSYEDASAAVTTDVAQEFFGRLISSGVSFTGLFSDVEVS